MLGIADCVAYSTRPGVPQPTQWQRIGDQIDAAMIFAQRGRDARTRREFQRVVWRQQYVNTRALTMVEQWLARPRLH